MERQLPRDRAYHLGAANRALNVHNVKHFQSAYFVSTDLPRLLPVYVAEVALVRAFLAEEIDEILWATPTVSSNVE